MAVGNNLRNLRKEKSITSAEMAEKLGLSSAKYSRIENDQAALDANLVPKITQEFNVPLDKIFQEDGKIVLNNPVQTNIKGDGIMVQTGIPENERKLYEQIVASLQETIASQKEMLNAKDAVIHLKDEANASLKSQNEALLAEVERLRGGK